MTCVKVEHVKEFEHVKVEHDKSMSKLREIIKKASKLSLENYNETRMLKPRNSTHKPKTKSINQVSMERRNKNNFLLKNVISSLPRTSGITDLRCAWSVP